MKPEKLKSSDRLNGAGHLHHLAITVSQATFAQTVERLDERGISHSGPKDRGFMDSIYFRDPLGMLIELAAYRFDPPVGTTHTDVLIEAHRLRVARNDDHIEQIHLADAIERLCRQRQQSLSSDRTPKTPIRRYRHHQQQNGDGKIAAQIE